MGIPIDAATGNPVGSSPQVLQFSNDFVPAQATTAIQYQANLPRAPSSGMLIGTDFEANPLAGAPAAAVITGSGATLQPDAVATGTGSVALTAGTTLSSLGINLGDKITINDGTNTPFSYTSTGIDKVSDLVAAINAAKTGGTLDVGAALNGTGNLVLTGTTGIASITVGGTATADTAIGFGAGANSFQPVNLLTQGAVSQGDTISVSVAGGTPTVITFGTGANQVATPAELQTAIGGITGLTGTVNTANGNIKLTSNSNIALDGSPTTLLPEFGIHNAAAYPANGTVIAPSMAVPSAPTTPRVIRSTSSSAGRNPAPVRGSCFIRATRRQPARKPHGRTLARCLRSIRAASSLHPYPA